jgi:hypothetical protein
VTGGGGEDLNPSQPISGQGATAPSTTAPTGSVSSVLEGCRGLPHPLGLLEPTAGGHQRRTAAGSAGAAAQASLGADQGGGAADLGREAQAGMAANHDYVAAASDTISEGMSSAQVNLIPTKLAEPRIDRINIDSRLSPAFASQLVCLIKYLSDKIPLKFPSSLSACSFLGVSFGSQD